ncbi:MAG TPA: D-alanyl-D-alanine carboxypeptidase/D-alanyl-D-alanine-endopeptidase [Thermomicrobiales bacterium]|nr:D-alanyl-D-alanine carboxypeptidase/D-alanyl-D-alanine-endopeptidase [Thermomicrobiales bacterium]
MDAERIARIAGLVAATRLSRRQAVLAGGLALTLPRAATARAAAATPLPDSIAAVMGKPRYAKSTWSLLVADLAGGETLYDLAPDQRALTGSVRKLFSVGLALRQLGADHRFPTPVYRTGAVDGQGMLSGDLILVAAGDLTLGGRVTGDDSIAFTDFDHNDANNLGTAILTPQDPLRGLDSLAEQIRAAGIQRVTGDVVVDDRLFQSFRVPNQNLLITPIMVNENMVDVTITPTTPGKPASVVWRPHTGAFSVDAQVTTTAAGTPDAVALSGNGRVECIGAAGCAGTVAGDIPADFRAPLSGRPDLVQTFRIEDPAAFARTAFIEALQRAGVTVTAAPVGANPAAKLPPPDSYAPAMRVAQFVSPPYAAYARLILKVSLNLGANLSLMLFALAHGKRTIADALAVERQTLIDQIGLQPDSFDFPTNGSGSPDSQASPRAVVRLLTAMAQSDVADVYRTALPILGVDGSLAGSGGGLPAKGRVFAKTGTTVENGALKAQNLAGYIEAKSGRRLAFALFLNDAGPLQSIADVSAVFEDEAEIANAIYEAG